MRGGGLIPWGLPPCCNSPGLARLRPPNPGSGPFRAASAQNGERNGSDITPGQGVMAGAAGAAALAKLLVSRVTFSDGRSLTPPLGGCAAAGGTSSVRQAIRLGPGPKPQRHEDPDQDPGPWSRPRRRNPAPGADGVHHGDPIGRCPGGIPGRHRPDCPGFGLHPLQRNDLLPGWPQCHLPR